MARHSLFSLGNKILRLTPRHVRPLSTRIDKFDIHGNSPIPTNKQRLVPTTGSYPKGFKVGSIHAGIKPASNQQPDLVLVVFETPASAAAVFTKNEFCAPSVTVSREIMRKTTGAGLQGVIANSGCANLFTGQAGLDDAVAMSREAGRAISSEKGNCESSPLMVMHTGQGAQRLPMDNILKSLPRLAEQVGDTHDHWLQAAVGLCTSDTYPKLVSRKFTLPSSPDASFSIAGLTKGAGMIHPNMATTLGIICTDAPVTPAALQVVLRSAASKSYNCISIDGDTSTNDMVAIFANGAAAATSDKTTAVDISEKNLSADFIAFLHVLDGFMADMAKLVVRDAEGATKFITIRVRGAPAYAAAKHIASVVARSVLIKTAIYGQDSAWGGIVAALGYALIDSPFEGQGVIVPEKTSVSFVHGGVEVKFFDRGVPVSVDGALVKEIMANEDLETVVDLRDGEPPDENAEEAVYWTCDMTHDFISLNSGVKT